ncbi:MAG: DNA double-strand break repair nuclease NurA [Candidatus Micrarchaeota archaeon]
MREKLATLATEIRKGQAELRERALEARGKDPGLVVKAESRPVRLSACAVDGGLLAYRLHGHDIVAVRAAGVNFVYDGSVLNSFSYHPGRTPKSEVHIRSALDEHEANVLRSLLRLRCELSCAIMCLERYSPAILLLDGSLWTVPSDQPGAGSALAPLHEEVVGLYKKLFAGCHIRKTMLAGVVKDSRSKRLAESLGFPCSDTVLASYLLEKGERTSSMPYSDKAQKEPAGPAQRLKVFYIKPSENDLPLRIEHLAQDGASGDGSDEAASVILSLSSISDAFAYPAILIEADMRAAMDPSEAERLQADISALDIRPLRRDSRPFR